MSLFNGKKVVHKLIMKPKDGISKLVLIGDVHCGATMCDVVRLMKTIDYVKNTRGCYAFLMGDLTENVTMNKDGSMLEDQKEFPTEQIENIIKLLKPIKNKILGTIRGNHGLRTMKESLLDIDKLIASNLGVPYFKIGGNFLIQVGKEVYKSAMQHGRSSGTNPLTELNKMKDVYSDSEVCALGHNHALMHGRHISFTLDKDGKEKARIVHLLRTGTYLGYADYSREALYNPPLIGSPIIKFFEKEHKIEVDIDLLAWEID